MGLLPSEQYILSKDGAPYVIYTDENGGRVYIKASQITSTAEKAEPMPKAKPKKKIGRPKKEKPKKAIPWDDDDDDWGEDEDWGDEDEEDEEVALKPKKRGRPKKKKASTPKKSTKKKAAKKKKSPSIFADPKWGEPLDDEDWDDDEEWYPEVELERVDQEEIERQMLSLKVKDAIKYGEIVALQETISSLNGNLLRKKKEFAEQRCPYEVGQLLQYAPIRKAGDEELWVDFQVVSIEWSEEEPYYICKAKEVSVKKGRRKILSRGVKGKAQVVDPDSSRWRVRENNDG